jgi:hemerythrin
MALLSWNSTYSVGVASIDAQHMSLFDSLNELHTAMLHGKAKTVTGGLLRNLLAYTRDHFSSEEALLARTGFPDLAQHRRHHRELTQQVAGYVERFDRGEAALSIHLMTFLREWLANHILREDRAYTAWLVQHGIR